MPKTATNAEMADRKIVGKLDAIDCRELRNCCFHGYSTPDFSAGTGTMSPRQWRSWQKLSKLELVVIEGSGEADDIVLTATGERIAKLI